MALAESLLLGAAGVGVQLELTAVPPGATGLCRALFSETAGRALVSVSPEKEPALLRLCTRHGVEIAFLGATTEDGKLVIDAGTEKHELSATELADAYYSTASIFPDQLAGVALH